MITSLDEDGYLRIHLLSYDKPAELTERFYFLEMSTLQIMILLEPDKEIISTDIVAYNDENEYLGESEIGAFKKVDDFNSFFLAHPEFYIHNCDIKLKGGVLIRSHDDGEVSIEFLRNDSETPKIIEKIFNKYHLDKNLIGVLKNKPGHCIALNEKSQIIADFKDFDDYVANGRK